MSTEDLEAILPGLGGQTRYLTPQEQQIALQRLFRDDKPEEILERTLRYRIAAAYRITREHARIRGHVSDDQTLSEALPEPDDWEKPLTDHPPAATKGHYTSREALNILNWARQQDDEHQIHIPATVYDQTNGVDLHTWEIHKPTGLPILPPPPPIRHRLAPPRHLETTSTYDPSQPNQDPCLHLYCKLIQTIADSLYVESWPQADREAGRLGMIGLTDPALVRTAFPSRAQMILWEELMISETLDEILTNGIHGARKTQKWRYGLQEHEATALMRMARVAGHRQAGNYDPEEEKSMMVLRLEEFAGRCRGALDLRAELGALKQMAIVMGLARDDEAGGFGEIVDVVRRVAAQRVENRAQHALTAPTPPSKS